MTKKTKEALGLTSSKLFALTGSFSPSHFRFFEASADMVAALHKVEAHPNEFRKLPSVKLVTHQGYVGTNGVFMGTKEDSPDEVNSRLATNPGMFDRASLSAGCDTLVLAGTVKFVSNFHQPSKSDSTSYRDALKAFVTAYEAEGLMPTLMARYLANIVEGRLLWRNQYGFNRTCVIGLRTVSGIEEVFILKEASGSVFDKLVSRLTDVAINRSFAELNVALSIELGSDAEVFPSQPFIDAASKKKLRNLDAGAGYGRLLCAVPDLDGNQQVIFTSQKIGNALRTIDLGYADDALAPIAIELYGAVTGLRIAHRLGKKSYFHLIQQPYESLSAEDKHFVMGVFIKGGLLAFGDKD